MKVKWHNCFFCLIKLHKSKSSDNDDFKRNKKIKRLKLILKYLIGGGDDDKEEKVNVSEEVVKLWTSRDGSIKLCDKCDDMVNGFIKLHVELEVIQMQIVEIIKQVRKVIVEKSKYCGGDDDGEDEGQRGEEDNKIFETLNSFQGAVFKAANFTTKNIPCIYLERYRVKSPFLKATHSPHLTDDQFVLKIEPEEEYPANPLNQDTFDLNDDDFDDLEPTSKNLDLLKLEPNLTDNFTKSKKRRTVKQKRISPRKTRKFAKSPTIANRTTPSKKPKTLSKKKTVKKPSTVPKNGPRQKKRHSCEICQFSTKYIYKFEFHLRKHEEGATETTSQKPYSCAPCNLSISTKQNHDFHMASHQGRRKLRCDLCNERVDHILLSQHMKGHLDGKKEDDLSPDDPNIPDPDENLKLFPCSNCSYCSSLREKYLDHVRDHHGKSGQYFCDFCNIKMADRAKYLSHLYTEHNAIQKLTCDFEDCKMEYLDSYLLWNHKEKHRKLWICESCGKACSNVYSLKVHERNHTGERPYPCTQCPEWFKYTADLNRHTIDKHNGEKFQCQFCDKQYKYPNLLKNHLRTHTGTTFPCNQCGRDFVSNYQLKRHMTSHSTERKFACDQCGKCFRTTGTLTSHMQTHSGALKYKCTYCTKAFLRNENLTSHLRTHTGERPFVCDICGSSFTQAGPLSTHKKKQHSLET